MCAPEARSVFRDVIFSSSALPYSSPQHLTVLMFSHHHRLPGARGFRSAAHGDRLRRNPKRNWFPPDDYPSVGWSIPIYTYTLYVCGYNAIYIVSFFSLMISFSFSFFPPRLKNRCEGPLPQDKLIIRLTFFSGSVKRF